MSTAHTPPDTRRQVAAGAAYVLLALAAFVLTSRAIAWALPRHVPAVDVKWEYFSAHKDEYTTVYLGTSVIHRHIVPAVLDAELGARGQDERSFNFGVARMTFAEASVLLERIFALEPAALRRVVVDAHLFTDSGAPNHFSARHIWWHTPAETYHFSRHTLAGKGSWADRWDALQVDVKALLINATAAGRAAEAFRLAWDPGYIEPDVDDVPVTAEGYRAIEELKDRLHLSRRRDFVRSAKKHAAELEKRGKKRRRFGAYEAAMLERLVGRIEAAGREPVLLEAPTFKLPFAFPRRLRRVRVISFNDPAKYPEMYTLGLRHDYGHLNDAGARSLSATLARRLTGEAEPGPSAEQDAAEELAREDDEAKAPDEE